MAALRQLLNARGTEAKMQALGYQISAPQVPDKTDSDRSRTGKTADMSKPLHSKYNETETPAWQHPLLRKDQPGHSRQDSYGRSNSFDDYSQRPNHLLRTNTDTTVTGPSNRTDESAFSMDVSSIYEDNESPALSPALNKHLALRPLDTQAINQTQEEPARPGKTRRRSRSATQESQPGYYGTDPWENYRKEPSSTTTKAAPTVINPRRKESLAGVAGRSTSKPPEESGAAQLMRDRNRSPTQLQKSKYDPSSSPPNNAPIKVGHNTFSSTSSPTDSAGNSISEQHGDASTSHPHHPRNKKRKRSLDYSSNELSNMDYVQDLQSESFDTFPSLNQLNSTHNLPSPSLPLADRLRNIYNTPTPHSSNNAPVHPSNDKAARARAFFASLQMDQYEECGDLLLDGFRDVMDRLRQARREKRQAARGMEELVAKREEWVRRKRGVLENELGRLRGAGVAVVKPVSKNNNNNSNNNNNNNNR